MKMRFIFFVGILIAGCGSPSPKTNTVTKSLELSRLKSEVPREVSIEFAENFLVRSVVGGYELKLMNPNTHEVEAVYELTYDHSKKGEKVIHIPVGNIATLSQTTVGMLSKIDALNSITGVSNMNYAHSPALKKRFKAGQIEEFGDETNPPIERIVKSKTNVVIYSGFGEEFDENGKLQKLGIASIPNYEWRENHPLGRAEWIKFVGILVGKVEKSEAVFAEIKTAYQQLCKKMTAINEAPKVISGNFYSDQWTAPAGNSYMAILIQDAGGKYVYKAHKGTGSIFLPIERVIADNQQTPYWIQPGIPSKATLTEMNPKAKYLSAYKNGIYCYSHDMNRFWENSAVEPQKLLEDLIHIFHPTFEAGKPLHYYKRIAN